MDVGLSIIMRKEKDSEYKVFLFLRPFDIHLWLAIVFTTLGVGVFIWLHSTFSPYGYHGRVAQASDPRTLTREQIKAKDYLRFSILFGLLLPITSVRVQICFTRSRCLVESLWVCGGLPS